MFFMADDGDDQEKDVSDDALMDMSDEDAESEDEEDEEEAESY